jgi:hypothetical protein
MEGSEGEKNKIRVTSTAEFGIFQNQLKIDIPSVLFGGFRHMSSFRLESQIVRHISHFVALKAA